MRNKTLLALTLLMAGISPAFAESPFLGKWTATAEAPGGGVSETVTVTKTADGYAVTARLVVPPPPGMPEAGPGHDIKLEGDRFTYKRSVGDLVITYSGVISGDKFTGTVNIGGMGDIPYNGVRIKE